jgi:hypothetical protein
VTKNIEPLSNETLFIQSWLRPALTPVLGNRDHQRLVDDLEQLDNNLKASGLEAKAMSLALDDLEEGVSFKQKNKRAQFALYSVRVELLRQ